MHSKNDLKMIVSDNWAQFNLNWELSQLSLLGQIRLTLVSWNQLNSVAWLNQIDDDDEYASEGVWNS